MSRITAVKSVLLNRVIVLGLARYRTKEPEPVHPLAQPLFDVSTLLTYGVQASVVVPVSPRKVHVRDMYPPVQPILYELQLIWYCGERSTLVAPFDAIQILSANTFAALNAQHPPQLPWLSMELMHCGHCVRESKFTGKLPDGDGDGLGDGLGVGAGDGDGVGAGDGLGLGLGVGEGDGEGVDDSGPCFNTPLSQWYCVGL